MARLLCSYGARPRHSHNCQGQTAFSLAKYVLRNIKMTKLLDSFSPTFNTTDNLENDNDEFKGREYEANLPLESPPPGNSTLQRVARASEVDGGCRKLQKTSLGVEMPTSPTGAVIAALMPAKKSSSEEASNGGSISARPYLHREVKSTIPQGKLVEREEGDVFKVCPRWHSTAYL